MFNKKYKVTISCLQTELDHEIAKRKELESKVDTYKRDNADLAEELRAVKFNVKALSVICASLMEVMSKSQLDKAGEVIKGKEKGKRKGKVGRQQKAKTVVVKKPERKKGKKNAKKAK